MTNSTFKIGTVLEEMETENLTVVVGGWEEVDFETGDVYNVITFMDELGEKHSVAENVIEREYEQFCTLEVVSDEELNEIRKGIAIEKAKLAMMDFDTDPAAEYLDGEIAIQETLQALQFYFNRMFQPV